MTHRSMSHLSDSCLSLVHQGSQLLTSTELFHFFAPDVPTNLTSYHFIHSDETPFYMLSSLLRLSLFAKLVPEF